LGEETEGQAFAIGSNSPTDRTRAGAWRRKVWHESQV